MNRRLGVLITILAVAIIGLVVVVVRKGDDDISSQPAPPLPPSDVGLVLRPVGNVDAPTAIAARKDDGSLYVAEQAGRIRRFKRVGPTFLPDPAPFADLSADVTSGGEQGLLGLAFAPDGTHLYVAFTNRHADQQLDELTVDADRVVDRRTLLVVPDFAPNHNGGDVVVGPDGFVYYTMGDGGGTGDPKKSGQDPHDLLGGILRIDPTKPSDGKAYGIPRDNPFADGKNGAPEVFEYGLRNPWRISFDRETRDLWIADVGQNKYEEIDFVPAGTNGGQNFGWSALEGTHPFKSDHAPAGAIAPIYEYDHRGGRCSITGGFVYRGTVIPALAGTYLFGDECDGNINGLRRDQAGHVTVQDMKLHVNGLSTFGEDTNGELYAAGIGDGIVWEIDARDGPVTTTVPATTAPPPPPTTAAQALSSDPIAAADQLAAAEVTIRDPAATPQQLDAAAHLQQRAYRFLGQHPELYDMVISHAPAALQTEVAHNLYARNDLALIPGAPLRDTLPAWRIVPPAPQAELLADYHDAESRFGVGWNYLAAINLIESAMGRIQGLSTAGAQGPMQFMPSTWDSYGAGGDINSPRDSIMAAARYLAANGFADGNVDGALFTYNNSQHYVDAIKDVAAVLAADPIAYRAYYRWEVFYVTTLGDVHLPVGYETPDRIPAADYLATHPQDPQ